MVSHWFVVSSSLSPCLESYVRVLSASLPAQIKNGETDPLLALNIATDTITTSAAFVFFLVFLLLLHLHVQPDRRAAT